jgi:hypothetical protein
MLDVLQDVQALEDCIALFLSMLVNLDTVAAEDKISFLAAHTLAHTSIIQLHQSFTSDV